MKIDLSRFQETFFQETAEHLTHLEAGLLALEDKPGDPELLNAIFRAAHSVKGGAGMLGFEAIQSFTHSLENLLDRLRSGGATVTPPLAGLLLESVDTLRGLVGTTSGDARLPDSAAQVRARLDAALGQSAPEAAAQAGAAESGPETMRWNIRFEPAREVFTYGLDPLLALRELTALGQAKVTPDSGSLPPLGSLDPEQCYLAWDIDLETEAGREAIDDCFCFYDGCAAIRIEPVTAPAEPVVAAEPVAVAAEPVAAAQRAHANPEAATIRVATAKVDQVIDLIGELVIAQSMVAQSASQLQAGREADFDQALEALRRQTRELQERVMSLRMVPAATVFARFARVVRDLASSLGKEIRLEIAGEETEIDRGLVEGVADPLVHLVRNAADHGMETAAERVAAGKPAVGVISLVARHEGGKVVIEVADDGRGLAAGKIRGKAIERGLIGENEALSGARALELIFEPGFSTAEQVTDVSGRGVGMDVVRRNIETLGGAVGIASEPGRGTRVRIELPLTLAILDGLLLQVNGIPYVVPLAAVIESIDPARGRFQRVAGMGEVVMVRGEPVPVIRPGELLPRSESSGDAPRPLALVVEAGKQRYAMVVDELAGQRQFVVKSLDRNYRRVDGVMGATILGDGRVALILDVTGLARLAARRVSGDSTGGGR
ncbi:MAG: chemotaxis protein CheA [Bryobacteraceae bacterium]